MEYMKKPGFWVAVIVISLIINFVWNKATGRGQLV